MGQEVTTPEFEFYFDLLPAVLAYATLSLAVRKAGSHDLDDIPEFPSHHAEQEDNPLLIDRFMFQTAKVNEFSESPPFDSNDLRWNRFPISAETPFASWFGLLRSR